MTTYSPFELANNLTEKAKHHFKNQPSSEEGRVFFNNYIERLQLDSTTPSGKRRYPKKTQGELFRLWLSLTETYSNLYCVFGYWYEGEFYTTYKNSEGLKTTNILHKLEPRLSQAEWDRLESGLYYKDTLKKYY